MAGGLNRPRLVALMGPTASGKTATGIAWAHRHHAEIVSVDSALVYRHLDIGSAKPTLDERDGIPHHLIDVREPWQPYSAAEFAAQAQTAIADILARGKLPLLVGGTGLYFQALLQGLGSMPAADAQVRARLNERAAVEGWAALHAELARVDPAAAQRIHATDAQRIQRALEVYELTGTPISELQQSGPLRNRAYHVLKVIVAPHERAVLHQRIAERFDAMLAAGFLDEVRALRAMPELQSHPQPLDLPAIRAVGYRQAWIHLDGQTSFEQFREQGIAATRQLAKRQFTWLRSQIDALRFDPQVDGAQLHSVVGRFLGIV